MEKLFRVSICLLCLVFSPGCATAPLQPNSTNTPAGSMPEKPQTIIYKIDFFSKKANVVFVKKFVDGVPTITEHMKINEETELVNFQGPEDYLKDEIVYFQTAIVDGEKVAIKFGREIAKVDNSIKLLDVDAFASLVQSGRKMLLIDSRPKGAYVINHVPGAVSIPLMLLQEKGAELLPADKNTSLVFYCGGITCGMSPASAKLAEKFGYTNISVFNDGINAWKVAGHETHTTAQHVKSGNVVCVDLRDLEAVKRDGRIPGSVHIPFVELGDRDGDFPVYRGVPIVFYGDDPDALIAAQKMFVEYLYREVSILPNWKENWTNFGGELLFDGNILTKITWKQPHSEDAVTLDDFTNNRKSQDIVVDVREVGEYQAKHLPGAVNVPLAELSVRMPEIVKTMQDNAVIYLHCATGIRARGAHEVLMEQEYFVKHPSKLKFINDRVPLEP